MKYYYQIRTPEFGQTYGLIYIGNDSVLNYIHSVVFTEENIFSLSIVRNFKKNWYLSNKDKGEIKPYVN